MKRLKRAVAAVLCVALLAGNGLFQTDVLSLDEAGTEAVINTSTRTEDGITYTFTRKIQYVGGRTYNVTVDVAASLTTAESIQTRTESKSGYITVEKTGWYMLELWGGKGGNGKTSELNLAKDGTGGAAGHVYGKVFLEKGQILAYSIGTDGTQSLTETDDGGGLGGDGGQHGDTGSAWIGGGGGYSALYLIEADEFDASWLDEDNQSGDAWANMPESVRMSRYLMIAGGGGGGGAAPLVLDLLTLGLNGNLYAPNGGYGGRVNTSYLTLSGDGYDVQGYVFAGRDGYSSGDSTDFVGQGGSNVPGADVTTSLEGYDATILPNDWSGTWTTDSLYGAGGSGNLRGGGGGAGFCGGSGGIMQGLLLATNIGGGGGGSSFLAKSANGKDIRFLFPSNSTETLYLLGYDHTNAKEGGALAITYMGESDENGLDLTSFENVTFQVGVTDFFEILSIDGNQLDSASATVTADGSSATVTGLSIMPPLNGMVSSKAHIQMQVVARDTFAGGNGVKLLESMSVSLPDPNLAASSSETIEFTLEETADADGVVTPVPEFYVNVPSNLIAEANYLTSNQPGKSFEVDQLYRPEHVKDIINSLETDANYSHIASIGEYQVMQYGSDTVLTGTVSPTETTYYTVGYEVAWKAAAVETAVGPIQADGFVSETAVISVVAPGQAYLSNLSVSVAKSLSYADGEYHYRLEETQNAVPVNMPIYSQTAGEGEAGNITVQYTGWYYIQAWGGNGGSGGGAYIEVDSDASDSSRIESIGGSTGGSGGKVTQYVYLTAGTKLTVDVGKAGSSGTRGTRVISQSPSTFVGAAGTGGGGGTATTVKLGDTTLMIAGGGGGSAVSGFTIGNRGRYFERVASDTGDTGSSAKTTNSTLSGTYNGTSGGTGSYKSNKPFLVTYVYAYGGSGGSAGKNYINSSYGTTQDGHTLTESAKAIAQELSPSAKTGTGGQVTVTLIETPEMETARAALGTMETELAFSRYFDVLGVSMETTFDEGASFNYTVTESADGSIVKVFDTQYEPGATVTNQGSTYMTQYYATVILDIALVPKEGFLGGNDVPVLVGDMLDCGDDTQTAPNGPNPDNGIHISQGNQSYNPTAVPQTDYANVELEVNLLSYFSTQNKTVHLGDSVSTSQLYTFNIPEYTGADAWKDDFVEFVPPAEKTVSPTQDTYYSVTAAMRASIQEPQALVVAPVKEISQTLGANVYVQMPITYALSNLTSDGAQWVPYKRAYSFVITPESGYLMPDAITVTAADGQSVAGVSYNSNTGAVTVPAEAVVGPLTVTAEGRIKTYKIHIVYSVYDSATDTITNKEQITTDIPADAELNKVWDRLTAIEAETVERPGYEYTWTYDTLDGQKPATMPAYDLWVYGRYLPQTYIVTVNYVFADGTQAAEPAKVEVAYLRSFSIISPDVPGYLPDQTVIAGTQGTDPLIYTVIYTESEHILKVVYLNKNNTLLAEEERSFEDGQEYSFEAMRPTGYTPQQTTISGTMTSNASTIIFIYCDANIYTLNFVYNTDLAVGYDPIPGQTVSGTMAGGDSKTVAYDSPYSYTPDRDTSTGLPHPEATGYGFTGWYSDPALTQKVEETTLYSIAGDTTLYAGWSEYTFQLTVVYEFLYTEGDFLPENTLNEEALPVTGDFLGQTFESGAQIQAYLDAYAQAYSDQQGATLMMAAGATYAIPVPELEGYTPYLRYGLSDSTPITESLLTDTMPAANKKVIVTYAINLYTVRFMDAGWQSIDYSDEATVDASVYQADTFSRVWQTIENVKHGQTVAYEGQEPYQTAKETYTYTFMGWQRGTDRLGKSESSDSFWLIKQNTDYYTWFTAQENIISTYISSVNDTQYFTTVASALAYAETNYNGKVVLKFRRNAGNGTNVDLDGDILEFGRTYNGTTALTFEVDLNSLQVGSDTGATVLVNPADSYINLTLSSTGGQGTLYSRGTGDVVAATVQRSLILNANATLEAVSSGGNATGLTGVIGETAGSGTVSGAGTVRVDAALEAVGLDKTGSISLSGSLAVTSTGGRAVGVQLRSGSSTDCDISNMTVAGVNAVGIAVPSGSSLTADISGVTVTASGGDAYGVQNAGTALSPQMAITVTASGNAYGFYNDGGSVSGMESADLQLSATGENGYGLYSVGGSVGSEEDYLNTGVIFGSDYGIYCTDGSIFVSGNDLYFKGETEENALSDTVAVAPDYVQTEAYAPYDGYYRLARYHTITFDSQGGTAVAEIHQLYGTPLDAGAFVSTRRGYTLLCWITDPETEAVFTVPETMPDEDYTLTAYWEIVEYYYTLDTEKVNLKLEFYGETYGDTELMTQVEAQTERSALPDSVKSENMTYKKETTLYIHGGWYTEPDGAGEFVDLSGDLSALDGDGDGTAQLYSKWIVQTQCNNYYTNSGSTRYDFAMMGTTANTAANLYVTYYHQSLASTSTSSYGYGYLYYVVPKDGTYTVYYDNYRSSGTTSSYRKYVQIQKISGSTTTTVQSAVSVSCSSTRNYEATSSIDCKAGDVLVLRAYRYSTSSSSTYYSYVYGYVTEATGSAEMSYEVSAPLVQERFVYTVEMGDVTLPIAESDSGLRFSGWSVDEVSANSANWLMTLTPEMVEDPNLPWALGEVMNLHANWQQYEWLGYQTADRSFGAITDTAAVTIRENQTVTLRFQSLDGASTAKQIRFANALPAGTVLTLVNRGSSPNAYYTYTVGQEGISTLELSAFRNMADGTAFSGGAGDDLLLQIDCSHASNPASSQTVTLWAGAVTPESILAYQLLDSNVTEAVLAEDTLTYKESGTVTLDIPALTDMGFSNTDTLYLRVSWNDLKLVPGIQLEIGENSAVLYGARYGWLKLDTVASYTAASQVNLSYAFPTSVYWDSADNSKEFSETFTYELVVASGALPENVLYSRDVDTVGRYTQNITVTPTPPVTASEEAVGAVQGETLTLTFTYTERTGAPAPALYLYRNVDGYLEEMDAENLLSDFALSEGVLTATLQQDAEPGEYYVKFVYDDKCAYVQVAVTAQ